MIKVYITNRDGLFSLPPDRVPGEVPSVAAVVLLPGKYNLGLFLRKHPTNPNEGFLQNNWPVCVKDVNVMKDRKRLKNCCRFQVSKEIGTWNTIHDPGFSFVIKDIIGAIEKKSK